MLPAAKIKQPLIKLTIIKHNFTITTLRDSVKPDLLLVIYSLSQTPASTLLGREGTLSHYNRANDLMKMTTVPRNSVNLSNWSFLLEHQLKVRRKNAASLNTEIDPRTSMEHECEYTNEMEQDMHTLADIHQHKHTNNINTHNQHHAILIFYKYDSWSLMCVCVCTCVRAPACVCVCVCVCLCDVNPSLLMRVDKAYGER